MSVKNFNHCRLMLENHTLSATSVTVTPTPMTGYEAANLQDPDRAKLCKVNSTSMEIKIQMNGNPWVQGFFITGILYSVAATFRLRGNSADANWDNADYDSGTVDAYPASLPFGGDQYGYGTYGGYITPGVAPYHRVVMPFYFDDLKTHAWWKINIDDSTGSAPIGIGVAGLCRVYEMTRNYIEPWAMQAVDTTQMMETTAGDIIPGRQGTVYELLKLKFKNIPTEEMYHVHNALKTLGSTPAFIAAHPDDSAGNSPWTTLYGRVMKYKGFARSKLDYNDFAIDFREQPGEVS